MPVASSHGPTRQDLEAEDVAVNHDAGGGDGTWAPGGAAAGGGRGGACRRGPVGPGRAGVRSGPVGARHARLATTGRHRPLAVAVGSGAAALAAWALLALLERLTNRARTLWTVAAVVVLVASLAGPLSGSGITATNRTVLVLLHLTVGAVLILTLRRTAPSRAGQPTA
jgi:hypothetical protein